MKVEGIITTDSDNKRLANWVLKITYLIPMRNGSPTFLFMCDGSMH